MYNPIRFIKDVIDIFRDPPGEAVAAMEITPENVGKVLATLGPEYKKYAKVGDYCLEFESGMTTIAPRSEFHKHYAFPVVPNDPNAMMMTPVVTIKSL